MTRYETLPRWPQNGFVTSRPGTIAELYEGRELPGVPCG